MSFPIDSGVSLSIRIVFVGLLPSKILNAVIFSSLELLDSLITSSFDFPFSKASV